MHSRTTLYFFVCTVILSFDVITAQTTLASSEEDDKFTPERTPSQTNTLKPATTVSPSAATPRNFECDVNRCPNNERCLVRQAPSGTDFVCECASVRGSTFGHYCNHTYHRDFFSTIPLRTCYGPECATGSQSSENYPNDYKDRTGQMMVVYVPGTFRFDLSFDDRGIGIEYAKDYLVIGGGFRPSIEEVPVQLGDAVALPGIQYFSGFDTPADFSIFNDSMWIWFQTDPSVEFKGFNVSWTSVAIDVLCPEDDIILTLPGDSDSVRGGWNPPFIRGAGVGIENLQISSTYDPNDDFKLGRYDVKYQYRDIFGNTAECDFPLTVIAHPDSTVSPASIGCDVNRCPKDERCLVRQAPTGTDYVCECASKTGSTYGFNCHYTYFGDFYSTIPLRTCYGHQCATGSQSSENYPGNYNPRTGQMTVIYVPGTYRFDLSFDDRGIDIEKVGDDLIIGGGFRPPFDRLVTESGERNHVQGVRFINGDVTQEDFSIYNDSMWIWFQTDFDINLKGFNVSWRSVAIDVECPAESFMNLPDDASFVKGGVTPTVRGAGVGIENLQITSNYDPNYNFTVGSYGVEYQFRDIFNNKAECNFRLTVRDVTRPVVTNCSENVELQTCDSTGAIWIKPTASDNSGEMVREEMQVINGRSDSIQWGRNTVVYTFSDQSGNTQECRFTVNISCDSPSIRGVKVWIIWVVVVGVIQLLVCVLIVTVCSCVKLAANRDRNKAGAIVNPGSFQGHGPETPLEEEETEEPNGNNVDRVGEEFQGRRPSAQLTEEEETVLNG